MGIQANGDSSEWGFEVENLFFLAGSLDPSPFDKVPKT
jgi:hypothetical protein